MAFGPAPADGVPTHGPEAARVLSSSITVLLLE